MPLHLGEAKTVTEWEYDTTACVDCYYAVDKGVTLTFSDRDEIVLTGWRFDPRECPESDHYGFSWSPCECCGSRLGGDRYAVSVWREAKQ